MADESNVNEQTPATEEPKSDLPEVTVAVEDAGTLKKKVVVTVPRARIDAKYDEVFGELTTSAQVPGFRVGHAPRRLIEKRFGKEVGQDVRNAIIGDSLKSALDKADLKTIGEPDLDLEKITLPDSGDMTYDFQIEIAPQFELPETKGIAVTKHIYEVNDERVDEYLQQLVESRATFETAEDAAEKGDVVIAGAVISGEGIETTERPGLHLRVAPAQIEGLPLVDLGDKLEGKSAGDSVELKVTVPQAHPTEAWRGKELTVKVTISEVRTRVLPEIDEEFAKSAGFESLKELREFTTSRLTQRLAQQTQQNMREQVSNYLLEKTTFDLPEGLVERQTYSVLRRRYVDLLYQGVPKEKIDEHLTEMQAAAGEEAKLVLKLSFITDKIAEAEKIDVDEGEVNARIAQMAAQSGKRPERMRHELSEDGSLGMVESSLREEKVLQKILEQATVTEEAAPAPAKPKARKVVKKVKPAEEPKKEEPAPKAAPKKAAKEEAKKPAAKKSAKAAPKKGKK
ncbi:MAG: trigger factor [Planctomycetaceae bacterium]|nr:trigger factor [Planctomycetaceae bacterium]